MGRFTGYAGLHDYNRAIREIATSADWQSGQLGRQIGRVIEVAARSMGVGRVGRCEAVGAACDSVPPSGTSARSGSEVL